MALPSTETIECDILIISGGMSGCGSAFEAKFWGRDLRVVMVEKAVIERSGATGEGLSAINCYMGQRYGWNTPEDGDLPPLRTTVMRDTTKTIIAATGAMRFWIFRSAISSCRCAAATALRR